MSSSGAGDWLESMLTPGDEAVGDDLASQIIGSLPGVFYLFRAEDGRMLRWNRALEARTGRTRDEIADCHPLDLIAPADRETAAAAIQAAIDDGASDCEAGLADAQGGIVPHYFCGRAASFAGERCVCGLGIDISPQRSAQQQADRIRERLVDAIEAISDGFASFDASDRLLMCNRRYRELSSLGGDNLQPGNSFAEILRVGLRDGLYPDARCDPEQWLAERTRRRRENPRDSFEQQISTGKWLRVEEHPTRDDGRVSILVDITAYKKREAKLRESEERYRALFENEFDAIVISDIASGRILDANARAANLLGYDHEYLLTLARSDLHPPTTRNRAEAAYSARCQQANAAPFRQQLLCADGTPVPVEISATLITDEAGNRHYIQAVIRDVTPRERLERMTADRGRILESIARRAPLAEVLVQVQHMLERLRAARCARAFLVDGERLVDLEQGNLAGLDASWLEHANRGRDEQEPIPLPLPTARALLADFPEGEAVVDPLHDRAGRLVGALVMVLPPVDQRGAHIETSALVEAARLAAIAIEQQHLEDQLSWQAGHDDLTELPNRALLMDRLRQAIAQARRRDVNASVLLLDLDDFKIVNDSLGHAAGDRVLQIMGERLGKYLRDEDTVARIGGDEFVLVLPISGAPEVEKVAAKLVDHLAKPLEVNGETFTLTPSIGISVFPDDGTTADELLQHADAAMYAAKHAGKGRCCFYRNMDS